MPLVDPGQVAATTLAGWLASTLTGAISVYDRWVEPSVALATRVVTVSKVGRRSREDAAMCPVLESRTIVDANTEQITVSIGQYEQALQLEIWAGNDPDREDTIAQLDAALNTGTGLSLPGGIGNPFRDGLLLPITLAGYSGFIFYDFSEPEIADNPDSSQVNLYRCSYLGSARGGLSQTRTVARLRQVQIKTKGYSSASADPAALYDTTTLTTNPSPPPAVTVTRGKST
jgi:hypothetical protein